MKKSKFFIWLKLKNRNKLNKLKSKKFKIELYSFSFINYTRNNNFRFFIIYYLRFYCRKRLYKSIYYFSFRINFSWSTIKVICSLEKVGIKKEVIWKHEWRCDVRLRVYELILILKLFYLNLLIFWLLFTLWVLRLLIFLSAGIENTNEFLEQSEIHFLVFLDFFGKLTSIE